MTIYKIEEVGNNELKSNPIAEIDSRYGGIQASFCPNPIRKTFIASNGGVYGGTFEFSEKTGESKELDLDLSITHYVGWGEWDSNTFVTSQALWIHDETKLYRLDLADYSIKVIDLIKEGYEILAENMTCSMDAPDLSFSGLRYFDVRNVIGTIHEDGSITVFEQTETLHEIKKLVRLN